MFEQYFVSSTMDTKKRSKENPLGCKARKKFKGERTPLKQSGGSWGKLGHGVSWVVG